jgi:diketogulonate reductase-like aldo/keto reductase
MTPDDARAKFHEDLIELGVDYVDLLLLHEHCDYIAPYPYNASAETAAVYAVLEEALANGTARAIGVSNFRQEHFEPLLQTARVVPAVNQARMSLGNADWETIRYCQQHNITYQVYSPLHGGGCDDMPAASSPTLQRIAQAHGMDIYQLQFRWMAQNNLAVVTATNKSSHMTSDVKSFEFTLTDEDMSALNNCTFKKANQDIMV